MCDAQVAITGERWTGVSLVPSPVSCGCWVREDEPMVACPLGTGPVWRRLVWASR